MVAESNLTFNQIAQTKFIRDSLSLKYPDKIIPKYHQDISGAMMRFYELTEAKTKELIQKLKRDGKKFSATLDEWTSTGNSRYLNINLHYTASEDGKTRHINLVLIKIDGKCPADVMVRLVSFFSFCLFGVAKI